MSKVRGKHLKPRFLRFLLTARAALPPIIEPFLLFHTKEKCACRLFGLAMRENTLAGSHVEHFCID